MPAVAKNDIYCQTAVVRGWKVEGDQGLGHNTGALAPHARSKVGCGRGSPPPAVMVRGITTGKFLKTQMLNPAFWWLLAVKFLAFWKLLPRSWGDQYIVGPQPKSRGPVSPGPFGCCAYRCCVFLLPAVNGSELPRVRRYWLKTMPSGINSTKMLKKTCQVYHE